MLRKKILFIPQTVRCGQFFSSRCLNFKPLTYQPKFCFSQEKKDGGDPIKKTMAGFEKFQRVRKTGNSVEIKNEKNPAETTTNVKASEKKPQEETLNQTIEKPNEAPKEENLKGFQKFQRKEKKETNEEINLNNKNEEEKNFKGFAKFKRKANSESPQQEEIDLSKSTEDQAEKKTQGEDLKKINPEILKTIEKLKEEEKKMKRSDEEKNDEHEQKSEETKFRFGGARKKLEEDDYKNFKKNQEKIKKKFFDQEAIEKKFTVIFEYFMENLRVFFLGSLLLLAGGIIYKLRSENDVITFTELIYDHIANNKVKSISINRLNNGKIFSTYAIIHLQNQEERKVILSNSPHFIESLEKAQMEMGRTKHEYVPVNFEYSIDRSNVLTQVFEITLAAVTIVYIYTFVKTRGGGLANRTNDIFGIGKSNVKVFGVDNNVKVRFKDVAGLNEAKLEISEFVDFLKRPRKYKELGARLPRGALLTGPPGTGKTMLAKACAGEAGVPFLYISGSDFVEMFVGVGAARVRDLFKQAKSKAPSMIFIDEIDAVGRKRDSKLGGNDERDNTLNQLLVEMDGFGTDSQVVVIAATNRKELLDNALTRPGRFDRTIEVSLPDLDERKAIFLVHLKPLKLNPEKKIEEYARRLATLTPGFTGAEISNLCNEAGLIAARKNKEFIDSMDFELASERVIAGLEKKKMLSEDERKIVAYHESGHAVVSWFLKGGAPLLKVTILPRSKGSLGFAQYLPNEASLESKEELIDQICCILGGRCSEEIFFNKISTGAYNDIEKAYEIAYNLVTKFGMSEKIGFMGLPQENYYKRVSENTQKIIDEEVKKIIENCKKVTKETIETHRQQIDELSKALLEKETLDLSAIMKILGERPFPSKSNFKEYLETKMVLEEEKVKDTNTKENENVEHIAQYQIGSLKY